MSIILAGGDSLQCPILIVLGNPWLSIPTKLNGDGDGNGGGNNDGDDGGYEDGGAITNPKLILIELVIRICQTRCCY